VDWVIEVFSPKTLWIILSNTLETMPAKQALTGRSIASSFAIFPDSIDQFVTKVTFSSFEKITRTDHIP
jgi:hypothetical protein